MKGNAEAVQSIRYVRMQPEAGLGRSDRVGVFRVTISLSGMVYPDNGGHRAESAAESISEFQSGLIRRRASGQLLERSYGFIQFAIAKIVAGGMIN